MNQVTVASTSQRRPRPAAPPLPCRAPGRTRPVSVPERGFYAGPKTGLGRIARFVFTPEDTTGSEKTWVQAPKRNVSTRRERFKTLFWIAASVAVSLAIGAL